MTTPLHAAAKMALDALGAMKDAMLDQGVNTDPAHPNRMALNYGVTAMRKLRAALAAPHYPLPDSLYPGSKDWMAGDYADRVEWLHMMYESKRQEVDALLAAPQGEPVAYLYTLEYGATMADTRLSEHQLNYPFGVVGSDYLLKNDDGVSYVRQTPLYAAPQPAAPVQPPKFPTMLRKMWSGSEVQQWINDNWEPKC
jgi:hypothetical protein